MDGFNFAKQLIGKTNTEEEYFLKCMQPARKAINLKNARRIGKYLYVTEKNQLVSLAIIKSKPRTDTAHGVVKVDGLKFYVFTNEA
ncbi:hypothetical protein NEAUS04_1194 [Nematocida ausubeli]|uniref:Uncharacterized protein n=1 Tax=Nematocida ausubeli (strain ATCC PRA-371 / ERTm2) TaxID=1913371 RepID=A0A086J512_NEMA1|nr:uncharacterized protein NESG_00307 [Nematocida ausubeli]KAI5134549.1 hypothetical protein NEAUS07_0858 [Nematocida ausubeli]KAI5136196.1 hypothetical protein NEAUS06_1796 [Nematocida ausubeli]KAI5147665.1 hypothetical protein NEAUS05_0954 [Nematocida ausubeli]KAI5159566.1 hypothetical protein NEAUS03_0397 [Nematocida ausubeli]KAI5162861.1 hypothetical protein NEAUS04_1194 [Nematocida ausubeli]